MTTKEIPCPTCGAPAGKVCASVKAGKPISDMHHDRRLLSCRQAAALGIERLRKPIWSDPLAHLKIDIVDGELGRGVHLFSPFNQECNGRDPVDVCLSLHRPNFADPDAVAFAVYDGPLPDSEEYRAAAERYEGTLS